MLSWLFLSCFAKSFGSSLKILYPTSTSFLKTVRGKRNGKENSSITKTTVNSDIAQTSGVDVAKISFYMELEELVICKCENTEHQMIFRTVEGSDEVYVSIFLRPDTWWRRIAHGIKYIFGHRSRYGDFDELILRQSDVSKFEKVVDYLKRQN